MKKTLATLQEFSVPLIAGVLVAMLMANLSPEFYHGLVHIPLTDLWGFLTHGAGDHGGHVEGWKHYLTLHFLANDILMALFFGIAAKEITEACLPNGALNPPRKAVNPLFATFGGVAGPIAVFLGLNAIFGQREWRNGWGIPTATDIALAWLVARILFGKSHSAVSFLLLLAVADDAIGLGIIAFGYPDPLHPTQWSNLMWLLPGMGVALGLRLNKVYSWIPYIAIGGGFCWWGLYSAHLHPALALVFVVPFLPPPKRDEGLFQSVDYDADDAETVNAIAHGAHIHSTLENFEHDLKAFVDFGLFFFAFANAGVPMSEANGLTWILLTSLVVGKTVGIVSCSWFAAKIGFPLPAGMSMKHLFVTGLVAALGLTVALFVSSQAFTSPALQGSAKMGAVFSAGVALVAWVFAEILGVRPGESFIAKLHRRRSVSPATTDAVIQPAASISAQTTEA
jgi:NhaA family Na+:H+ antiporter